MPALHLGYFFLFICYSSILTVKTLKQQNQNRVHPESGYITRSQPGQGKKIPHMTNRIVRPSWEKKRIPKCAQSAVSVTANMKTYHLRVRSSSCYRSPPGLRWLPHTPAHHPALSCVQTCFTYRLRVCQHFLNPWRSPFWRTHLLPPVFALSPLSNICVFRVGQARGYSQSCSRRSRSPTTPSPHLPIMLDSNAWPFATPLYKPS